jgi:hypothetical protein
LAINQIAAAPDELVGRVDLQRQVITLETRQTSTIPNAPPQCQSICNPINTAVASGCPVASCCQTSFEMGYFNCFQCAAQASNVTDFSLPQQVIDDLVIDCSLHGVSLPKLTYPGQNPNRVLSTMSVAPSTSSTAGLSQTTVFSVTPSPPISQTTITAPPSTTSQTGPAPSSNTASAIKSVESGMLGLGIATLVLGACFYLGL